jgi:NAD(P)-dependent dehydrogenase (short-subunit alcohol dehydrogenase family)
MRSLRGRVVVLTGASAGIGRDTAVRLAARGAVVVGAARDLARLESLAADAPGVEPVRCDVSVAADREALVAGVLERHGRIDALVNNAGLGWEGLVEQMPAEKVEQLWAVNVVGLVELCRLVLPSMLAARSGDIVNISSMAGHATFPPFSVYCATKAAVNGFTESLRREVRFRGVRVHLILPGPIETEWLPRSQGFEPLPGSAENRFGGFSPIWVARAIERCLTRPGPPRTASVPRVLGAGRVLHLYGVRQAADVLTAFGARAYAARAGAAGAGTAGAASATGPGAGGAGGAGATSAAGAASASSVHGAGDEPAAADAGRRGG